MDHSPLYDLNSSIKLKYPLFGDQIILDAIANFTFICIYKTNIWFVDALYDINNVVSVDRTPRLCFEPSNSSCASLLYKYGGGIMHSIVNLSYALYRPFIRNKDLIT